MTAPRARIATVKGVWIRPGVSRNRRLYTRDHVAAAVAQAQRDIAAGETLSVLTHHGAADPIDGDTTRTVGRVTKVGLDPAGNGTFEADIADTDAGRAIAALVTPERPYLRTVSMRSVWNSAPHTVRTADGVADTADEGFTLRGIDFTPRAGVPGAGITSAELAEGAATAGVICEEIEEALFVDEPTATQPSQPAQPVEAAAANTQGADYADPGYQTDKKKRYPLTSAKRVRAANSYINVKANADKYTSAQLKRIKGRIAKAAKKFGIDLAADESFVTDVTEIVEAYASMSLDNGPATVRVSTWVNEPEKLAAVGRRIAVAALAGLHSLDPDNDGDIDLDTAGESDTDDDMSPCTFCSADVPAGAGFCPTCGQAVPVAEAAPAPSNPTGGSPVGDTPNTTGSATESAPARNLTDADVAALAAAMKATESAPAEPAAVEESEAVKAARKLVAEADAAKTATASGAAPATAPAAAPVAPAAPVESAPQGVGAMTTEQFESFLAEHDKKVIEGFRAEYVKNERANGPRRVGLRAVAESESVEEIYGADKPDLSKASHQDLEKLADHAVGSLIDAIR